MGSCAFLQNWFSKKEIILGRTLVFIWFTWRRRVPSLICSKHRAQIIHESKIFSQLSFKTSSTQRRFIEAKYFWELILTVFHITEKLFETERWIFQGGLAKASCNVCKKARILKVGRRKRRQKWNRKRDRITFWKILLHSPTVTFYNILCCDLLEIGFAKSSFHK